MKGGVESYAQLLTEIDKDIYNLSIGYDANPDSKRADLGIRISVTEPRELQTALEQIRRMMRDNALDDSSLDRLRDLVAKRLSNDDAFLHQPVWMLNSAFALRNETNALFLALNSELTRMHWDYRMKWRLHTPVSSDELNKLGEFTKSFLSSLPSQSRDGIARTGQFSGNGARKRAH